MVSTDIFYRHFLISTDISVLSIRIGDSKYELLAIADANSVIGVVQWSLMSGSWNANTPEHVNNYRLMTWTLGLNAVVQKQLLCDNALTLRFSLNDILYHTGEDLFLDCGDSQMHQANKYASQRLCFSMRYVFNSAKSKYRGTGAGKDVLDRMK